MMSMNTESWCHVGLSAALGHESALDVEVEGLPHLRTDRRRRRTKRTARAILSKVVLLTGSLTSACDLGLGPDDAPSASAWIS